MPVPAEIQTTPETTKGTPSPEEMRQARQATSEMDNLFDDDAAPEAPTAGSKTPESHTKTPPSTPAKAAEQQEEAPVVKRQPRILPAIPKEVEEDEEVVDVEGKVLKPEKSTEGEVEVEEEAKPDSSSLLADALKKVFPEKFVEKKDETVPEMKQEDYDRLMKVYKPAPDLYDRMANPESREAAMNELVTGLRTELQTFSFFIADKRAKDEVAQYQRTIQQAQQQQTTVASQREQFLTDYPVFKDDKYKPILHAVAQTLKSEGFVPKDVNDMRKTLAERTAQALKAVDSSFDLGAKTKSTTTVPKPTVVKATGGRGGADSSATSKSSLKAAGTEVFD